MAHQTVSVSPSPSPSPSHLLRPSDSGTESEGGILLVTESHERKHTTAPWIPDERRPFNIYQNTIDVSEQVPDQGLNWCNRGIYVDFRDDELVPLRQGRFLGPGVQGGVYETSCKGVRLAWKKRYCPRGIRSEERREIEILKRLSHRHIIKLIGTYTHGPFLGLLLWPVAICDLATFMEDVDILHRIHSTGETYGIEDIRMVRRLHYLCPDTDEELGLYFAALSRLSACFSCLTGAIAFIHEQRIRHKDVKPSNVLLSHDGLWLADFGMSSDFSTLSTSQSEAVERGTLKYFAPEVATYERSGRAADIFSLGCVFLEILALYKGISLHELRRLRPEQNGSFQANLAYKGDWLALLKSRNTQMQHLLCEIDNMVDANPRARPSAAQLNRHLSIIDQFASSRSLLLHGPCCAPCRVFDELERMAAEIEDLRFGIRERDDHISRLARPGLSPIPPPPMGKHRAGASAMPHRTDIL